MLRVLLFALMLPLDTGMAQGRQATSRVSPHTRWLLGRTPGMDAVHASDSEGALVARYGRANVVRARVDLGEGESEPGILLFPRDHTRRLEIHWSDTTTFVRPTMVVAGDVSRWRIYPGVGIGTSLRELELLNGRPFVLSGMEWDAAGGVVSWNQGELDRLWAPQVGHQRLVWLRLSGVGNTSTMGQVVGDHEYRSDLPAMARLNPRVYALAIEPR